MSSTGNQAQSLCRASSSRLALILLLGAGTPWAGACVFPQDDHVIPELPPRRNSRIRVVNQRPQSVLNSIDPRCAEDLRFEVDVEDDDGPDALGDGGQGPSGSLFSRWFLDRVVGSGNQAYNPDPVPFVSKRLTMMSPADLKFRKDLTDLDPNKLHRLEVFVADTVFKESIAGEIAVADTQVRLPDNSIAVDPGTVDSFTWILKIEPGVTSCAP